MTAAGEPPLPLVSTEWLAAHQHDPKLRIVDVRWRSHYENGRGISIDDHESYREGHIPGAVFAGMKGDLSDQQHAIPDMLVEAQQFAQVMARIGIGNDTVVVTYDNMGFPLGSARLWWALSYYGHDDVRVLDGGLRQWQAEGRPLSKGYVSPERATFVPRPRPEWIANKHDVLAALDQPEITILD